jgi:hypothetical protein
MLKCSEAQLWISTITVVSEPPWLHIAHSFLRCMAWDVFAESMVNPWCPMNPGNDKMIMMILLIHINSINKLLISDSIVSIDSISRNLTGSRYIIYLDVSDKGDNGFRHMFGYGTSRRRSNWWIWVPKFERQHILSPVLLVTSPCGLDVGIIPC